MERRGYPVESADGARSYKDDGQVWRAGCHCRSYWIRPGEWEYESRLLLGIDSFESRRLGSCDVCTVREPVFLDCASSISRPS